MRCSIALAGLFITTSALAAPEKSQCLSSYEKGQRDRLEGHYSDARAEFVVCANDACPGTLRPDCVKWLDELELAIPSVVLSARDEDDREILDVEVREGAKVLARKLDGRALALDPGKHQLTFVRGNGEQKVVDLVLHEGERTIPVAARFVGLRLSVEPQRPLRPVPWTVYAFGGLSALALGTFVVSAASGRSEQTDELDACRPSCSGDQVDSVRTKYLVADVALGVSVLSAGAAAYFFFTRPTIERSSKLRVAPLLGGVSVSGTWE